MTSSESTRPNGRRIPRWAWITSALVVMLAAVLVATFWIPWSEHAHDVAARFDRHPMLDDADGSVCRAIRKAWNRPEERRLPGDGVYVHHVNATGKPSIEYPIKTPWQKDRWDKANRKAVLEVLDEAGVAGPLALLRVLVEEAPLPHHGRLRFRPACDGGCVRFGLWLRENAPPALDPLLLALVEDEDLHFELRMKAVVGLCRPQSRSSLPALAAVANDPLADDEMRSEIIQRLHRMEAPLLEHLAPLLYQPFHGLDEAAAMALALSGESQAPSLLLRMVRHASQGFDIRANLLGRAVWCTTGKDPRIRKLGEQFSRTHGFVRIDVPFEGETLAEPGRPKNEDSGILADAFAEWLEAHPEARNTRFERECAAYLAGAQRRRERAIHTFDDQLETPERDFDLGLAAAWGSYPETDESDRRRREVTLDRLHRLTLLLRRDLEGRSDPEAIIEILARRLFPCGERVVRSTWEGPAASSLVGVLDTQHGNCVGNSVLLLAIGQRLGLPLHGVHAPGHMFVRWDDGESRRNIETTDHGAEQPDEDYLEAGDHGKTVTSEERAAGTYLGNLSRRQAISMMFGNLAHANLEFRYPGSAPWRLERARKLADEAIRLAPDIAAHYLTRASARMHLAEHEAAVRRDLETARRLDHDSPSTLVADGTHLLAIGDPAGALERFQRAHAASPRFRAAELALVQGLLALDRLDEARARVEDLIERKVDAGDLQQLRLTTLVRQRDARWTPLFEEMIDLPDAKSRFLTGRRLRLVVAALLLRDEKNHPAEPRRALEMLEEIPDHGLGAPPPDSESRGLVEPIKAPNGETIWIFHKHLREIETRRDELRADAESRLAAPEK